MRGDAPTSDFLGLGITHAAGCARADLGGWCMLIPVARVTVHANVGARAGTSAMKKLLDILLLGINLRARGACDLGGREWGGRSLATGAG